MNGNLNFNHAGLSPPAWFDRKRSRNARDHFKYTQMRYSCVYYLPDRNINIFSDEVIACYSCTGHRLDILRNLNKVACFRRNLFPINCSPNKTKFLNCVECTEN